MSGVYRNLCYLRSQLLFGRFSGNYARDTPLHFISDYFSFPQNDESPFVLCRFNPAMVALILEAHVSVYLGVAGFRSMVRTIYVSHLFAFGVAGDGSMYVRS